MTGIMLLKKIRAYSKIKKLTAHESRTYFVV